MPVGTVYSERVVTHVNPHLKSLIKDEAHRRGWRESDVIRMILTDVLILQKCKRGEEGEKGHEHLKS